MTSFGERVRIMRQARDLSLDDLARRARILRTTLERIEASDDGVTPQRQTVQRLATALGVDPYWLRYGMRQRPKE